MKIIGVALIIFPVIAGIIYSIKENGFYWALHDFGPTIFSIMSIVVGCLILLRKKQGR